MSVSRALLFPVILLAVLSTLTGCQGLAQHHSSEGADGLAGGEPPQHTASADSGGMLLRTGSIQLGPGVGKNLWGWQDDGQSGF